jgi:short-subunit dehydrogenase
VCENLLFERFEMTENEVAIISGASSGIGAETARLFTQKGFQVVLGARRLDRLRSLKEEIEKNGGTAVVVQVDVGNLEQVQDLVERTIATFGRIDVLVNNAGFGRLKWLEALDPIHDVEAMINVNLLGAIHLAQAVLPYMIERRHGHIINIASVAAHIGTPTLSVYSATKFGLRGFSEALRREVQMYNINVTLVSPGGVATEFEQHTQASRKTGVTTPKILQLSANDVARTIIRQVYRPRPDAIIPGVMRMPVLFNWVFPKVLDWLIEMWFTRRER